MNWRLMLLPFDRTPRLPRSIAGVISRNMGKTASDVIVCMECRSPSKMCATASDLDRKPVWDIW